MDIVVDDEEYHLEVLDVSGDPTYTSFYPKVREQPTTTIEISQLNKNKSGSLVPMASLLYISK